MTMKTLLPYLADSEFGKILIEEFFLKLMVGLYRRAEFHNALIEHYFFMRQKRFLGPKEAFTHPNF